MRRRSIWWPVPSGPAWAWPLTVPLNLCWAMLWGTIWFTMLIFSAAVRAL